MLTTAKVHYDEDIERARSLLRHADGRSVGSLQGDILRSSIMMAVGACDAYFCDAYADMVSRALRAKELEATVEIPDRLANLRVPAIAVIRQATGGWRWRMAARELIENETVLSLSKIRELFNQFFPESKKFLNKRRMGSWILHRDSKMRWFGISSTDYRALALDKTKKSKAREKAAERFEQCFAVVFQRRHDCIHNCDRPKMAIQSVSKPIARKIIEDVDFLVSQMDDAFNREFPKYLARLGFSAETRSQVIQG